MTIRGTIRRVWGKNAHGVFTVIVEPHPGWKRLALWTKDQWLATLAERYGNPAGRPLVTVIYNAQTKELLNIPLPVTQQEAS